MFAKLWRIGLVVAGVVPPTARSCHPNGAADPITMRTDEHLAARLRRVLRIHSLWEFPRRLPSADASLSGEYLSSDPPKSSSPKYANINLALDSPVPACLAFDVFAVVDGREIDLGHVVRQKGESGVQLPSEVLKADWPAELGSVTMRLRSSRAAASGALDRYEVWEGEIELGPWEVGPTPFTPKSQPAPALPK